MSNNLLTFDHLPVAFLSVFPLKVLISTSTASIARGILYFSSLVFASSRSGHTAICPLPAIACRRSGITVSIGHHLQGIQMLLNHTHQVVGIGGHPHGLVESLQRPLHLLTVCLLTNEDANGGVACAICRTTCATISFWPA